MKQLLYLISSLILISTFTFCTGSKKSNQSENVEMSSAKPVGQPGPPAIVYKTKADYLKNVPVILNTDKSKVISFPDPKDLTKGGDLTYPQMLDDNYLLDNRGINENVAFLSITYEDYIKLTKAPTPDELMNMLMDKDPLLEMYDCGLKSSYSDIVNELNQKINDGSIKEFKILK
ncbi:MAG TPA: hypothetical protein P5514_04110 [Bacteroidales bacterium]|nr:hypothetical protein [Bacteroidales bacterium]HPE55405.1 hypothetical protein [Bacteroidales bacterium]HRX96102.1 hypothetical protein [Bacteroidales bacterium]